MSHKWLHKGLEIPQTKPLPGMVMNDAGGYSYPLDKWQRLRRFLITGAEGGTYYVSEREVAYGQISALQECFSEDPARVVQEIYTVSNENLAPKNDMAIFALAYALSRGDNTIKSKVREIVPDVVRTGTHLLMFCEFIQSLGGWGRAKRKAVASWYEALDGDKLAYQLVKYRQRGGWTHRDALRLSHPSGPASHGVLYEWATKGTQEGRGYQIIEGYELAQKAKPRQLPSLIQKYNLPREAVPTDALKRPEVWEALVVNGRMPYMAMIRNLTNMSRVGYLTPLSAAEKLIGDLIADQLRVWRSRIHPMHILLAMGAYAAGHSVRGGEPWVPCPAVVEALDAAFHMSFGNVEPTGKRMILGVDCSGSMGGAYVHGYRQPCSPAMIAAAMALVTAHVEKNYLVVAFATAIKPVQITRGMRLNDAMSLTALATGEGTDCSVPINLAIQAKMDVDAFVIYTDGQTWAGRNHPSAALEQFRHRVGHEVRMVNVGITADRFSLADPSDPFSLDVAGFDASTPSVISEFLSGKL